VDTMFADRPTSEDHTAKASSQDTLETVAKQVEARIAASDRDQRRADDHLKSAGLLLIELKKRLKIEQPGMSWPKWSTIHLSISVSRQYVLIAIAEGKTTAEAERAKNAKANQEHRARAKENPSRDGKASKPHQSCEAPKDKETAEQYQRLAMMAKVMDAGQLQIINEIIEERWPGTEAKAKAKAAKAARDKA
jgi:hypothetical protein